MKSLKQETEYCLDAQELHCHNLQTLKSWDDFFESSSNIQTIEKVLFELSLTHFSFKSVQCWFWFLKRVFELLSNKAGKYVFVSEVFP